jgi:hypothetical protein
MNYPVTFNPLNLKRNTFMFVDVFISLSTFFRLEHAGAHDLASNASDTASIGHSELSSDIQSQATMEVQDNPETNNTTATTTSTTMQQELTENQDTHTPETAPSNIEQISTPPISETTTSDNVLATEDPLQPPQYEFDQQHEEVGEANITEFTNEGDQRQAMMDMDLQEQDWQDDESHTSDDNWQDEYPPPMIDPPVFAQRTNGFIPPDDDNVYSMELRELLGRYVFSLLFMFYLFNRVL